VSAPARFLFDECLGKPLMETVRQTVPTEAAFVHICDYLSQGVLDTDWIPQIAREGGWVVITSDGGKHSKKGDKLPELCREHGITHVVLSATLHAKKSHEKVAAIIEMWEQIEATVTAITGTRFQLQYKNTKRNRGVILTLVEVPPPAPPPPPDTPNPS
jgi:hypothetical protein